MNSNVTIHPGDVISAMGLQFTVWRILYQDYYRGAYDVEFIDDQNRYHHWKQEDDGGTVTRSGLPGIYYMDQNDREHIACIREARAPGTYSVRIISRSGEETYLGRYSRISSAEERLNNYGETHGSTWRRM